MSPASGSPLEKGLLRFEAYQVAGEDALIIHKTFENTDELKFHLTKGTAEKYKKDIDEIADSHADHPRRCSAASSASDSSHNK